MSDATQIEIETETPTAEATPPQADEQQSLLHRIREAGEAGRKEWEEVLSKARDTARRQGQALYGRAQDRGANLLLGLLSRIRQGAETLERTLQEARREPQPEAPEAVEVAAGA